MIEAIENIIRRCREAGLEFEEYNEEEVDVYGYGIIIFIPRGRNRRGFELHINDTETDVETVANAFLELPFEKYRMLEGYEASWSPEEGVIECNLLELGTHNYRPYPKAVLLSLGLELTDDRMRASDLDFTERVEIDSTMDLSISIGPSSDMHSWLQYVDIEDPTFNPNSGSHPLVLRIEGATITDLCGDC